MSNCVISGNSAGDGGGGASSCILNHCSLAGNSSVFGGGASSSVLTACTLTSNSGTNGGGAFESALFNCLVTGNAAFQGGGGMQSTLTQCTVVGNLALEVGGRLYSGRIVQSILYYNYSTVRPDSVDNYFTGYTVINSCTTPLPIGQGPGNITNAPLFANLTAGNLRLQSNSPCIDAGNNNYASGSTDRDGRLRIVGRTVDMGEYESQGPGLSEFIGWLSYHALPTDGSVDSSDTDHDGQNNWEEWRCGTDPTNARSVLRLASAAPTGPDVIVSWQSVPGLTYDLEWSTNFASASQFRLLAANLTGQPGTTTHIHTNSAGAGPGFYRVSVR